MNLLVIAPILLPLIAGTLLLLLRRTLPLDARRRINLGAVLLQLGLAVLLLRAVADGDILVHALGNWPAPYGIVMVADRLSAWLVLVVALLAVPVLLYGIRGTDEGSRHFHPLFQLQLFGLNGAFLTGDLFNLFVFFEILLLASYGLLVHGGGARRTRAGLHFVAINLIGSTLFLFAVGTLYGLFGTLNMADLARRIALTPAADLGTARAAALLLFGVFALKAALVPLSLWLPAAYSATSAPVAALFAIMTKVGAYSILRLDTLILGTGDSPLASLIDAWLLPLALLTLTLGILGVLAARELRRLVAWLVVVSVGVLLTAFGLGTPAAIQAGLYYLAHSTFAAAALFLMADMIANRRGALGDRLDPGPRLADITLIGALFFVAAILIAGLPPLSGFLSKFLLLRAALDTPDLPWVMSLVLAAGLLSLIALTRAGSLLIFRGHGQVEPPTDGQAAGPTPGGAVGETLPVALLLLLGLALTVLAGPIADFAGAAAMQLLAPEDYIQSVLEWPAVPPAAAAHP